MLLQLSTYATPPRLATQLVALVLVMLRNPDEFEATYPMPPNPGVVKFVIHESLRPEHTSHSSHLRAADGQPELAALTQLRTVTHPSRPQNLQRPPHS